MELIYLDWAATTPISSSVLAQMINTAADFPGNPSSVHREGKKARDLLSSDRKKCALLLGTEENRIFFTSGGTESNSIILNSLLLRRSRGTVLISGIEHPSIYEYINTLKAFKYTVTILKPDKKGVISPESVGEKLTPDTVMVIVMFVNNETGTIQPIAEIAKVIHAFEKKNSRPIHFHTDAVQALGKIPFSFKEMDVDSASFSAHKIQAPRGVGILYAKKVPSVLSKGGGQESGVRPGTENLPGIHAFTTAIGECLTDLDKKIEHARKLKSVIFKEFEKIPGIEILQVSDNQSPFIINLIVKHFPGEVFTRVMSDRGFAISSGSACSSRNKSKKSRVLTAMGIPEDKAFHFVRVSTGSMTTEEDIYNFCGAVEKELSIFRRN